MLVERSSSFNESLRLEQKNLILKQQQQPHVKKDETNSFTTIFDTLNSHTILEKSTTTTTTTTEARKRKR